MNDEGILRAEIADMRGSDALPRSNGELVFAAPWEGRVLAMGIAVVKGLGLAWEEFRRHLIAEIAAHPDRPYYESWLSALERLLIEQDVISKDALARVAKAF